MNDTLPMTPPVSKKRGLFPVVKWTAFTVVMIFIARRAWQVWEVAPPGAMQIEWVWLIPSLLFYSVGWFPAVVFWQAMLRGCGQRASWYDATRSYYFGHLGKYVPGKAAVLVIRAGMMKQVGVHPGVAAVTAVYETLTTMGAGLAIAVALAPIATSATMWKSLPSWMQPLRTQVLLLPALVIVATLAALPILSRIFTRLAAKMAPRDLQDGAVPVNISTRMLFEGLLTVSFGWVLFSLSLGCVMKALGASFTLADFPVWMSATTLSTVGGFVVLIAPGGLGVREMLQTEVLQSQPGITETQAFLAAWLLRAVWMAGEVLTSLILLWKPKRATLTNAVETAARSKLAA